MPAVKKAAKQRKHSEESVDIDHDTPIDVQYNPEVIRGILEDLKKEIDSKCVQIQRDVDFMALSLQQAFNLELIKLPSHVKHMPLSRFKEEFGDSIISAVTRGAIASSSVKLSSKNAHMGLASATKGVVPKTPLTKRVVRGPKEGEVIVSLNGSPLGEFKTEVKAPKMESSIIPPTPGIIMLDSGAMIDASTADSLEPEAKQEAIQKVQGLMDSMQAMMEKLSKK